MDQLITSFISILLQEIVDILRFLQVTVYGTLAGASALLVEIGIEKLATIYLGRKGPYDGVFWSMLIRLAYGGRAAFEKEQIQIRLAISCGVGALLGGLEYCGMLDHLGHCACWQLFAACGHGDLD
ncbi:hypothetical protein BDZ91DRAFT_742045 [Kalaharituber pfeilii]|nr:hypothetical protein BDZ91DRAFT_742045 [Kalaharituber pfeilii]